MACDQTDECDLARSFRQSLEFRGQLGVEPSYDQCGATAIEYGLIVALIAVAIITGATTVGTQREATFTNIGNSL